MILCTLCGLAVGTLILCANFQFGLQTGWVSMMSMPSALLGFACFRLFNLKLTNKENVYIQSVAVAVGTGPLSFGFVGAIPAIEKLITKNEGGQILNLWRLLVWCISLAFMGIFLAIIFRKLTLRDTKMVFPSGLASAKLIEVLHADGEEYKQNILVLMAMFTVSFLWTLLTKLFTILNDWPILGKRMADKMWTFQFSPAYIGQGIIMGFPTTASMMLGAVIGWGLLVPLSIHKGWAYGDITDWQTGAQGWIMWVSLSIMVGDTAVSFALLCITSIKDLLQINLESENPKRWPLWCLILSGVLCILCVKVLFVDVPVAALTFAVLVFSPFLSLVGIRALGETDLNPVSSIAKLTQFVFGVLMHSKPNAVLLNIVSGAITEAGAQQAGDLMQEFKTGELLNAPFSSQTLGMLIGTLWSLVVSGCVYRLYTMKFEIPGKEFRIPTAYIWADCARLMTGGSLPQNAAPFAIGFCLLFVVLAVLKHVFKDHKYSIYIPSGVAVGIGMYNVPSFTIARFLGGLASCYYDLMYPDADKVYLAILSSGLILGEGLMSVVYMLTRL